MGKGLYWFRGDLRLEDHPALDELKETVESSLYIYIIEENKSLRKMGSAQKWWLYHSLKTLSHNLEKQGAHLLFFEGDAKNIISQLISKEDITHIFWSRRYGLAERNIDKDIKASLKAQNLNVKSFNATLLKEPWEIKTDQGGFYKVYSPFKRAFLKNYESKNKEWNSFSQKALPKSLRLNLDLSTDLQPKSLEQLDLLPTKPNWAKSFAMHWTPGQKGAHQRFDDFINHGLEGYANGRDFLDKENISKMSAHIRFGEISLSYMWQKLTTLSHQYPSLMKDIEKYQAELLWREFAHHLLYHFPELRTQNFNAKFDAMVWQGSQEDLEKWQRAKTGYEIVDAAMNEVWQSGFMHNRARMVVASFLTKHLLIDWRKGEEWFWDVLVDACPANNVASWQWVAGSGADAAPYFRIFNPMLQAEKFDPDGAYIKKWKPYSSKQTEIIDHKFARNRALEAYEAVKNAE